MRTAMKIRRGIIGTTDPITAKYDALLDYDPVVLLPMDGAAYTEYRGQQLYFEDPAGTTPAVDVGDPVGAIVDLVSGAITATQADDADRPVLGESSVIGGGGYMTAPAVDLPDQITLVAAVRSFTYGDRGLFSYRDTVFDDGSVSLFTGSSGTLRANITRDSSFETLNITPFDIEASAVVAARANGLNTTSQTLDFWALEDGQDVQHQSTSTANAPGFSSDFYSLWAFNEAGSSAGRHDVSCMAIFLRDLTDSEVLGFMDTIGGTL